MNLWYSNLNQFSYTYDWHHMMAMVSQNRNNRPFVQLNNNESFKMSSNRRLCGVRRYQTRSVSAMQLLEWSDHMSSNWSARPGTVLLNYRKHEATHKLTHRGMTKMAAILQTIFSIFKCTFFNCKVFLFIFKCQRRFLSRFVISKYKKYLRPHSFCFSGNSVTTSPLIVRHLLIDNI